MLSIGRGFDLAEHLAQMRSGPAECDRQFSSSESMPLSEIQRLPQEGRHLTLVLDVGSSRWNSAAALSRW
jgi:hypothetical protein